MTLLAIIGGTSVIFALAACLVWFLARRDKGDTATGDGVPFVITDGGISS